MPKLLYVCEYNVDRSPTAKVITEFAVRKKGINLSVDSAGLRHHEWARQGSFSKPMGSALVNTGYKPLAPNSKIVTPELLASQDLVLCFEDRHADAVREMAPDLEGRIFFMKDFDGKSSEIPSPSKYLWDIPPWPLSNYILSLFGHASRKDWGGNVNVHVNIVERIEEYVQTNFDRIVATARYNSEHPIVR
ncbi:MAG TPA: hypothetical protein VJI97_02265 [Candidatus Nanoarchaeia archaeon]|nr:hypothetical protein [Candidatus Nanoarchaeia archaeon]